MRTQKAIYNLSSNFVVQIIATITGLVLPRLIISEYGSSVNGLVVSIKQFVAYLTLVEAGIAVASIYALYKPLSEKHFDKVNSVLTATQKFYNRSGKIFIILTILMMITYPIFVKGALPYLAVVTIIIIIAGNGVFEYFYFAKYRVILTANQQAYIVSLLHAGSMMVSTIFSGILIMMHVSIVFVLLVTAIIHLLRGLFLASYVKKTYSYINMKATPDMNSMNQHWDAFVHQLQGIIVSGSAIVLITFYCTLEDVSIYSIYYLIFGAITMLVLTFSNGLAPSFGQLIASNDNKALLRAYNEYEYFFYMVITWIFSTTLLLIVPFMELYTKDINDADYVQPVLAVLFIIVGVISSIRVPQLTIVTAAGHFKETKSQAIIETAINLTLSIILIKMFGINGALLGAIGSYSYRTIDFILYTNKRILSRSFKETLRPIYHNIISSILIIMFFKYLINISIDNWFEWITWGVIISIFSFIIILSLNYLISPTYTISLLKRVKSILEKKNEPI